MKNIVFASWAAFSISILAAADVALADDTIILATGRRDPRIYAIDFHAALKRHNNNTPNAIVSRSKVHPDRLDGTPVGDPANIVLSEDRRTAYVINHHGPVNNAEFLQRSEEHTSELQSQSNLVCRLLLEKKKKTSAGFSRLSICSRDRTALAKCS